MSNDELTERRERFARLVVELGAQAAAYRQAFSVGPNTLPATVWQEASRLANEPVIAARIRELRDEAAALTTINTAARMQWLHDIETADPNELERVLLFNCRHCRGEDHRYQWTDGMEFADACDAAQRMSKPLPGCDGGFGFNAALEPVATCSQCRGQGEPRKIVADTTKLTGRAARLYKGCRVKANGEIEILMHDQLAARDQLNRMLGAYKEAQSPAATPLPLAKSCTPEEAARAYMRMIQGK
ncbi:MAG: terminase small subunit [Pseudomonadota bacterium]